MKNPIVSIFLLLIFVGYGQTPTTVSGTVMNSKNNPVANALIYLDSVNSGVTTNKQGAFSVTVPEGTSDINVYSYKYGLLSSKVNEDDIINFVFIHGKRNKKDKIKRGEDVVMKYSESVGYYVDSGAPVVQPDKEVDLINYRSIYDLIRGRVAGVVVTQDNRIRIRGVNSVNSPSDPLFIVDGTPVFSIDNIVPMNVRDIKILKGSDAAIYGTRGANGVVIIRTKS